MSHAKCPVCERPCEIPDTLTAKYPTHRPAGADPLTTPPCEASGWLVEQDEWMPGRWPR